MLKIYYTTEELCGLPGPNLFFHGAPNDFIQLSTVLEKLSKKNDEVCLNNLEYVQVIDTDKKIIFKSSTDGNKLSKVYSDKIMTDVPCKFWQKMLEWANVLSKGTISSTFFIEFEEENFTEEINIIWEC